MTKIAQNTVAKLGVAFVAAAMLFSFVAPAKAQTMEELQAQIAALMAQIAALQGGTTTTTTTGCVSIAAPLTIGSEGASVTSLQNFLISAGMSIPAGATGYFGSQTQAALASWQAANGVSPAAGYYGPITKAAVDAKCVVTTTPDTTTDDSTDTTDDTTSTTLSGEASLEDATLDNADDDTIEEGADDAEIAVLTLNFVDGDAEVSRLDVSLESEHATTDPWDLFDEVSIWVDGDRVAKKDASDKDSYQSDDMTLRFTGLDFVAIEDEDTEVVIAATLANNIDSEDMGDVTITVPSIRYFDADGVASTEDGPTDTATVTIEPAGADDQIIVKTSNDDPDATTFQVENDSKSDWYTVFAFDLDTKDSVNDIDLNNLVVDVTVSTTSGQTYGAIVDDAELIVDGTTIDSSSVDVTGATATSGVASIDFDVDGDVTVDAGDRITVELRLKFKSMTNTAFEGTTVEAQITGDASHVDAEGADDITDLSGAAYGEAHTLRTEGIDTTMTDSSAEVTVGQNDADDYATFTIEVEVTAFEQDAYIPTSGASIDAAVVDNAGADLDGAPTIVVDSTANEVNNRYEVLDGDTETFTFTVTYAPGVINGNTVARLLLNSIGFYATANGTTLSTQETLPAQDYRTATKTIVN